MDVDERLRKETGAERRSREIEDRPVTENRELSDDERLEMFRATLFNEALPDLPKIPGYHLCWLTTTNSRDPIYRRLQLGYQLLRSEDVGGMDYATQKTGEYIGIVGVNEMVAAKLPDSLYQRYMREAHHDAPARQESAIASSADHLQEQAGRDNGTLIVDEGTRELGRNTPRAADFV